MIFSEITYSVLVVSASEKMNVTLAGQLPVNLYWPVEYVGDTSAARRKLSDNEYDLVIINTPLPDDFGFRLASDITNTSDAGVLMIVRQDSYAELADKITAAGILALTKPTTVSILNQLLTSVRAMRERVRKTKQNQLTVEDKIDEIRLVNRAKWLLIENLSMSEPDAHHYIEKQAMDQRKSRKEIAESIIRKYQ